MQIATHEFSADIDLDRWGMPSLRMRRTVADGEMLAEDYSIFRDRLLVGRIRNLGDHGWEWIVVLSMPDLNWASGTDKTFERARAAFARAWATVQNTLLSCDTPDDKTARRH